MQHSSARICWAAALFLSVLFGASTRLSAEDADFSTDGPFPAQNVVLADQKTPRELGFTDQPIMADIWGWTDPLSGEEYVIAAGDAHNVPRPVRGADQADAVYHPRGGVVFARLTAEGEILPLGVWRHPSVDETDHGDVQVFANHAYVTGEATGYGLVVFDLTKLRGLPPCATPEQCADPTLNNLPGFGFVQTLFYDRKGREVPFSDAHNLTIDEASGFMAIHAASTFKDAKQGKRRPKSTMVLRIDPLFPADPVVLENLVRASHDGWITRYHGPDEAFQGRMILLLSNGYKHFFISANEVESFKNPKAGVDIYQLTEDDGETAKIKLVAHAAYEDDNFGHQLALSSDHRHVFFNDEDEFQFGGPTRQIVFDISRLNRPFELFQCFYSVESISHDSYVLGNYLISSNYTSGVRVVDISSVEQTMCNNGRLNEIAYIDTEPRLNSFLDVLQFDLGPAVTLQAFSDFAGTWGNYPFFNSGYIVSSDFFNGIFTFKLDLPD